jgi:hypothetical protein
MEVGDGKGVKVGLGVGVSGVGCTTIGGGKGNWMLTGRSCNASTKAAITVSTMPAAAARPVNNGRQ